MSSRPKDETGKVYGDLLVIKELSDRTYHGCVRWLCMCKCGNYREVNGNLLRSRKCISCKPCGLKRISIGSRLAYGEAALNNIERRTIRQVVVRGLEYKLSREEFIQLSFGNCYYCGVEPKQLGKGYRNNGNCVYNGVDRMDNTLGYVTDNVVSCCGTCNRWKATLSVEEFLSQVERVYRYGRTE